MSIATEIEKRRTFGIISHPDAGKTTLTEKLLLFGGAIQSAGAVKNCLSAETGACRDQFPCLLHGPYSSGSQIIQLMLKHFWQVRPLKVNFLAASSVLHIDITAMAQFKLISFYIPYKEHHFGGLLL